MPQCSKHYTYIHIDLQYLTSHWDEQVECFYVHACYCISEMMDRTQHSLLPSQAKKEKKAEKIGRGGIKQCTNNHMHDVFLRTSVVNLGFNGTVSSTQSNC